MAGRLRRRLRDRGGGHRRRPPDRALGPRGRARRLGPGRGHRGRPAAPRAGRADGRRSCARSRATTRTRWRGSCRRWARTSGTELPGVVERVAVVDRAAWVQANTRRSPASSAGSRASCWSRCCRPGSGFAKAAVTLANRWITTRQLGLLLGFMGQRVLGPVRPRAADRRDDARPAPVRRGEHPPDRVATWACPIGPFRTWIALHETTHAFEFEAHPWLRPYLADRLERQLTPVQPGRVVDGPGRGAGARARRSAATGAGTTSTGWSA